MKNLFARLGLAFFAAAICATQTAAQEVKRIRVAVLPFVNTCDPRFPNATKDAVRGGIDRIAREYLERAFIEIDYQLIGQEETRLAAEALKIDFSKSKNRSLENLARVGAQLNAGFVVLAWFQECSQDNKEIGAIVGNLGGAQSQSIMKARVWLLDVPGKKLLIDGNKTFFEGEAGGPFFGTTRKGELRGNPQDVEYMIMEENKRRAKWLGKAAAQALYLALSGMLGFKSPP